MAKIGLSEYGFVWLVLRNRCSTPELRRRQARGEQWRVLRGRGGKVVGGRERGRQKKGGRGEARPAPGKGQGEPPMGPKTKKIQKTRAAALASLPPPPGAAAFPRPRAGRFVQPPY